MSAKELRQPLDRLIDVLRNIIKIVMARTVDHEQIFVPGARPAEEIEAVPVRPERPRPAADNDLQRLGQQVVGQMKGIVAPAGGCP